MGKKVSLIKIIICLFILFFTCCREAPVESLSRHELFRLALGKLEDQIDLFRFNGVIDNSNNFIYMKDGRIYILNGSANKVMEFTCYGDLIFLLYNPDDNAIPFLLNSGIEEGSETNRMACSYYFNNIEHLILDSQKRLYVVDHVPKEFKEYDNEKNVLLYERILRFDKNGNLLDFYGQEGIGGLGTPFPYINHIDITNENELVVIAHNPYNQYDVYWYKADGSLKIVYPVKMEQFLEEEGLITYIEKIVPYNKELIVMLSIYREIINPSTNTSQSIRFLSQKLYHIDIQTEKLLKVIDVPPPEKVKERIGEVEYEIPGPLYEWLGITKSGYYFFLQPERVNQYKLIILSESSEIVAKRFLMIEDTELYYKHLFLNETGIILGLFCFEEEAKVIWWRSDKLLSME